MNELEQVIHDYLVEHIDWELIDAMELHEAWWGVPVGPTLSMAHPPIMRGIL